MEGLQRPHNRILWERLQQKHTFCGQAEISTSQAMTEADWAARHEALYKLVGRAVYTSQMLETQLRLILAVLQDELEVQIDFRSLAAPENRDPLGKLIGALKSAGNPPATARSALEDALKSRNRVVHQFFVRNTDAFSHLSVFETARAELLADLDRLSSGAKVAHSLLLDLCRERGIDDAALAVRQDRVVKSMLA